MALITDVTNLDFLITPLQMQYGDYAGTAYSESVYRTALVQSVKALQRRWSSKYLIDDDNNITRNSTLATSTYLTTSPPIIVQGDEQAIILQGVVMLRQIQLYGGSSAFANWSTPDLSYSNVSSSKVSSDLWKQAIQDVDDWFSKPLGRASKRFFYTLEGLYPVLSGSAVNIN